MTVSTPFSVGQEVYDDLTRRVCKVVGLSYEIGRTNPDHPNVSSAGCWGVWVDSEWLGGARHPWEITELTEELRSEMESVLGRGAVEPARETQPNTSPDTGKAGSAATPDGYQCKVVGEGTVDVTYRFPDGSVVISPAIKFNVTWRETCRREDCTKSEQ